MHPKTTLHFTSFIIQNLKWESSKIYVYACHGHPYFPQNFSFILLDDENLPLTTKKLLKIEKHINYLTLLLYG